VLSSQIEGTQATLIDLLAFEAEPGELPNADVEEICNYLEALRFAREVRGKDMMLIRPDFVLFNGVSPDQRTQIWPEGVPNINPPRPF